MSWDELCDNCLVKPRRRGGRECSACSRYRQRYGRARPLHLIERDVERTVRTPPSDDGCVDE